MVLESDVFQDAIKQVENALLAGMKSSAIVDDRLRLRLLDRLELLGSLVDVLKDTVTTGQFAKTQLEEAEKQTLIERALKVVGWN